MCYKVRIFSSIHRAISLFTPLSSMSEYRNQLQSFVFNMKIVGVLIFLLLPILLIFTDGQKRKKSLRKKLDSLGKEKNKDKGKGPNN